MAWHRHRADETLSESILRCVRAVFKKKKRSAHAIDIRTEDLQSSHVCLPRLITDVSLLRLHAQQRDTHHHQHELHTKTLCQLPTLAQFKLCCIGVLTFGSLGTGSNPHPVTDPFSQQGSRYCEICLLLVSAYQVTTSLSRRATLLELHAMSMDSCTSRLKTSLFSCSNLGSNFTQSYLPPCRPPRCSRCWHTTTNWILSPGGNRSISTLSNCL